MFKSAPVMMMGSTPNRLMSPPVKKLGTNIPNTCHWMTQALSSKVKPQKVMASGVATISRLMTPYPNMAASTATMKAG